MTIRGLLLGTAAVLAVAVGQSGAASAQVLTGQVASAEEGNMEGVVVSAKMAGSTITVSVVTDENGAPRVDVQVQIAPGTVAFTVVVALVVVLLAFVNGMYKLNETTGVPGNVLVMSEGSTDELFSNLARGDAQVADDRVCQMAGVGMLHERPAAADRLDQPALAELGERLAHHRSADPELPRERALRRQLRA